MDVLCAEFFALFKFFFFFCGKHYIYVCTCALYVGLLLKLCMYMCIDLCRCLTQIVAMSNRILKKNSLWRHFEEIHVQYTECVDILQHCYELHIANIFRCMHRQQFHQAQHVCIIETVSGINICQCCKGIYLIFYVI